MRTLAEWLDYQQRIHPRNIELGLDRVREVWQRMGAPQIASVVITVGGTNGKGSTVAFLEAMLRTAAHRVGSYTSPHLLHYNERIRVLGSDVDDTLLIDAFERIEASRSNAKGNIQLTYFEFGTLAALWIFAQSGLDVALLEVGLGGRLDAVNIIDADAAIVTTVDLDHQDWLGNDVNQIGREKAGILRQGRPGIIGMHTPPPGLLTEAERIGANIVSAGIDYRVISAPSGWQWECEDCVLNLPQPALLAPCQRDNAAAALAALYTLRERLGWRPHALSDGVRNAHVAARLQRFSKSNAAELVIDVGHNPQAARVLAKWLAENPPGGRNLVVFGVLDDKDVDGIVKPFTVHAFDWHIASLAADTTRGMTAEEVISRMPVATSTLTIQSHVNTAAALDMAASLAANGDRILAFGSFFIAAAALDWANRNGYRDVLL
jgi:dihydrofolate synthase / folylpolyglutamate synthase